MKIPKGQSESIYEACVVRLLFLSPKGDLLIQVWLYLNVVDILKNFLIPNFFCLIFRGFVLWVFNTIVNNTSIILWETVLLVEETRVPGDKTTCCKTLTSQCYWLRKPEYLEIKLHTCKALTNIYHIKLYKVHIALNRIGIEIFNNDR